MEDRNKSGQQDDMQKKPAQGSDKDKQQGQQQGNQGQQGQQGQQDDQGQRDREKRPA